MSIKKRTLKNPRRGTETSFLTIPLEEGKDPTKLYEELSKDNGSFFQPYVGKLGDFPPERIKNLTDAIGDFTNSDEQEQGLIVNGKTHEFVDRFGEKRQEYNAHPFLLKKTGKKILIRPIPFTHTLTGWTGRNPSEKLTASKLFGDLKTILKGGYSRPDTDGNVVVKMYRPAFNSEFLHWYKGHSTLGDEPHITNGDSYSLELFQDKGYNPGSGTFTPRKGFVNERGEFTVLEASPKRISAVNVLVNPLASEKEKQDKMQFYKKEISTKYGLPVKFFAMPQDYKSADNEQEEMYSTRDYLRIFPQREGLERKVSSSVALVGVLAGTFFLFNNITGNSILNLSSNLSLGFGSVSLVAGLIAGYFLIKRKAKRQSKLTII